MKDYNLGSQRETFMYTRIHIRVCVCIYEGLCGYIRNNIMGRTTIYQYPPVSIKDIIPTQEDTYETL